MEKERTIRAVVEEEFEISSFEKMLILQYRKQDENMKLAVHRLLRIEDLATES